ncbi:MAG TPA: hypothetical protein VNO21_01875, partial [Polyangiaceae bacterium]|nr:hypothetical protein [Polyangiaceae bacterium]
MRSSFRGSLPRLGFVLGTWTALGCASSAPPAAPPPTVSSAPSRPPETRVVRRDVVILSRKSGTSVTTFSPDGSID